MILLPVKSGRKEAEGEIIKRRPLKPLQLQQQLN